MIELLMNRIYFSAYRFEVNLSIALRYVIILPFKFFANSFFDSSWMKKRLKKQGRTKQQAIKDGLAINEDIEALQNTTEADGTMILYGVLMASIIIMLPQCVIGFPYTHYFLLNEWTCILTICLLFVLSYLFLQVTIYNKDKYISYFERFKKDAKKTRTIWHVISVFILILLMVCWWFLFNYCRSKGS